MSSRKKTISVNRVVNVSKTLPLKKISNYYIEHRRAIDTNDLTSLRKAIENSGKAGDEELFNEAILLGNLEIVKCLLEARCPRYQDDYCFRRAINRRHIEIVKYFHSAGLVWREENVTDAALTGDIVFLEFMLDNVTISVPQIMILYCEEGHHDCILFLIKRGYKCDIDVAGSLSDNPDMIKHMLKNGLFDKRKVWNIYSFVKSLDLIKFCHEVMRIPWDAETLSSSINKYDTEVINYMIDNGCGMNEEALIEVLSFGDLDKVELLHKRGCPVDKSIDMFNLPLEAYSTQYYHDNIFNKKLCLESCIFCIKQKKSIVWQDWQLINEDFQSCTQWLPREMVEDVITLHDTFYKDASVEEYEVEEDEEYELEEGEY